MDSPEFTQSHLIIMFIFTSFMYIPYSALLRFNYKTLDEQNPNITVEGNATFLYYSYIKLTRNKKKQIGRVRYFHPMCLWEISLGDWKLTSSLNSPSRSIPTTGARRWNRLLPRAASIPSPKIKSLMGAV
ncbi:hypothetical protein TIFTF001_031261 [Ficus carica]|uniref:Legume lectin domain-containing protein n=1 Tax=Ficus carica TaxID=3494 RepID=A0AA88DUN8_FICCA|nr:hypothetical protein TIFTF001_031261 [Ficus carica]